MYVDIVILRSSSVSWDSFASWLTIVSTSATPPPASLDFTMIDTIRPVIGVFTRSEKRRSASVAGTPQLIWAAIFLISGVSVPYRPLEDTTIASARVIPKRPASATSRREAGGRPSIALMSLCFFPRKKPYGPISATTAIVIQVRNRWRASCAGVMRSTGSTGRSGREMESIRFRRAIRRSTTKRTTPARTMTLVRSFRWYSRTFASSSALLTISRLLFHIPDHEDEPELGDRDHQPDDDVQQGEHEPALRLADEGHDRHDHDEEQRERDDDRDEGLRKHPQGLHPLPHLEAVLLLELLRLHQEVRLQLPARRRRRDDALEEVLELVARGPSRGVPDRGEDVDAEELRVPGDPLRLLRDLAVHGLLRELLEDHVHRDVRGCHRGDERHRPRDPLVHLLAALLGEGSRLPTIQDGDAEVCGVRQEAGDDRDDEEARDDQRDRGLHEDEEQEHEERAHDGPDGGDRRVQPGVREVLLGPELDVGLQQVVLEVLVLLVVGLDEAPERPPCELLPGAQGDGDGLRALREEDHVVGLLDRLAGPEPLRLRHRPPGLELLEGARASQSPHPPRPPRASRPRGPSPSRPGSSSRSRPGTGSTRSRSSRSRGSRSCPSPACS